MTSRSRLIDNIELTTLKICEIIKHSDSLTEHDEILIAERISYLYNIRQDQLEIFHTWFTSKKGLLEIETDREYWNIRISKIMKDEKILVDNIKRKMDEAQMRLLSFQKQKSLMIYSNR